VITMPCVGQVPVLRDGRFDGGVERLLSRACDGRRDRVIFIGAALTRSRSLPGEIRHRALLLDLQVVYAARHKCHLVDLVQNDCCPLVVARADVCLNAESLGLDCSLAIAVADACPAIAIDPGPARPAAPMRIFLVSVPTYLPWPTKRSPRWSWGLLVVARHRCHVKGLEGPRFVAP
jgi:hypothetical protein